MNKLSGQTMDLVEHSIDNLKQLFPEVVTEGKIDFDKLKLVLGENIETNNEKYEFTWNGKANAIKLAQIQSMGTLLPDKESSENWDKTENLYIEGDNLEVLKLLQKSYFGKVKMIYIDPPYNTGKDFVYKDNFRDNIQNYKEQTEQVTKANTEIGGRYHTDWLNMMYPRLKLARNILKDDGVIFISIDDNEVTNLRRICDEIFGEENLIAHFAWRRTDNQANIGYIAKVKEYILCYCKNRTTEGFRLNKIPLSETAKKEYSYKDEHGSFRRMNILDKSRGKRYYKIVSPSGEVLEGPWMIEEDEFKKLNFAGKIYWANNTVPYGKRYLHEAEGQIISDWLTKDFGTNQRGSSEINILFKKRIFDFVKPTLLIRKFIEVATEDSDYVLDFFSGSATTADAVMKINSENGTSRKFIMVQLPELTNEKSEAYKSGFKYISDIGKERIRRAGDKIVSESGKIDLDIGFKVFKLESSNIKQWNFEVETVEGLLESLENNILEGRTNEDLLYEILLKIGLPLTAPIEIININGKIIYNVSFGSVLLCLEDDITLDIVNEMLNYISEGSETKVIFKEIGFLADTTKTNAIQTLKKHGIKEENIRSV